MESGYVHVEPGTEANIVVRDERCSDGVLALDTVIHEVDGSLMLLARPEPPHEGHDPGRAIKVSYMADGRSGPVRVAFPAVVIASVDHYRQSPGGGWTSALRVERTGEAIPYTIRECFRVEPTGASRIDLYVDDRRVKIVDISLGGVKWAFGPGSEGREPGPVTLRFSIGRQHHDVAATLLRTWRGGRGLWFAVARFDRMTGSFEQDLARKVRAIERAARESEKSSTP
jgi:hypothetical protein